MRANRLPLAASDAGGMPVAALTGCHAIDFYTPSLEAPVPPSWSRRGNCRRCRCRLIASSRRTCFRSRCSSWFRGRPIASRPTTCCRFACWERCQDQPINGYLPCGRRGHREPRSGLRDGSGGGNDHRRGHAGRSPRHLQTVLQRPDVSVQLARSAGTQQITAPTRFSPTAW